LALANSFIEKVDMFSSVQSGSRSAPCTTPSQQPSDKELLSDKDLRFAERIKKTANGNSEFTDPRKAKEVPPTLLDLAAAFCGANIPLNRPEDVVATRKFVDSIGIAPVQHAICRSLPPPDPKLLVQGGVSLDKVAATYGIEADSLEMAALTAHAVENGPAGARVLNGESCIKVAAEYGLQANNLGMHMLQRHAVKGLAGKRVRNGESCIKVADEHGIAADSFAMDELRDLAVKGRAGERVQIGESCIKVAKEHGISAKSYAMRMLWKRAVEGLAG
jgi:hypothetical protein